MSLPALNRSTLKNTVARPVKVLQFGEGNFLRAFVDWIVDVLNEKTAFNGDVQLVQPLAQGMGPMVNQQDGLYHVLLNGLRNGQATEESRLITCVRSVLNPYEDFKAYLELGENPDLEFVISNTTEAGIAFDEGDRSASEPSNSFPGKLTALLYHRFSYFKGDPDKALTIIPCELIDRNGEQLRDMVLRYATYWKLPGEFSVWIQDKTRFCNTLVDRIVPGFPKEKIKEIQQQLGFEDNLIVTAEPFHLWVIQPCGPAATIENLKAGFPANEAGLEVLFTKDQSPYRTRKVRILNGAHTAMVPVAYLNGLRTVRDAVQDDATGKFIEAAIIEEIIPTLDLPLEELTRFANAVIERFQNPYIKHELISIALNSVSKYKVRVLPSVLEYIKRKKALPEKLLTSLASLIIFYGGRWKGEMIPVNDTPDVIEFMANAWSSNDPSQAAMEILGNKSFWDQDLTAVDGLASFVTEKVVAMAKEGR